MASRKYCGGSGGKIDPSNLHLRKEVLKDAGAMWQPRIDSVRTLTKHHYMRRNGEVDGNAMASEFLEFPLTVQCTASNCNCAKGVCGNAKKGRVFLYNWRSRKSESEVSRLISEDGLDGNGEGSFSTQDDENELTSDACFSERHSSRVLKCKDVNSVASVRRVGKNKSRRGNCSGSGFRCNEISGKKVIRSRCRENGVDGSPGFGIGRDDAVSLMNPSDDTVDLRVSPLLARLRNNGWAHSPDLSKSSCNKYGIRNASAVDSWDATTGSFNDADDEVDEQLDLPGCGIPCYWSRRSTPKSRVWYGSCCSPSVSDTLRRKRSQSVHQRRRHCRSNKRLLTSRIAGQRRSSVRSGESDEELSTKFEELDLEPSSRLDGRRWSTHCRSSPENVSSVNHKYRPVFFEEVIGQNVVVQSLSNAISRGRITPVYLFQGPRGTGKTSMARIFAAALNCLSAERTSKPCGVCRECVNFVSGKGTHPIEVDGSDRKIINNIKNLLKSLLVAHHSPVSRFKVFVVDKCHLLPPKTWLTFLRMFEKPVPNVVIILMTTDIDNVPRTVLSRCQKHIFNKISSSDIGTRLRKIAAAENLDVESDALDLIAMNADGSLRDAETMLNQLSSFGKRIDTPLVNELVGVVSDEKLLDLLELAMSSNAKETVRQARELMDSGVDPLILMSQMAGLIVDIIAGTYPLVDRKPNSFFHRICLSERELDRLKHALACLSEAEKCLRASTERSTWFTATLLQLGSVASPDQTQHRNSTNIDNSISQADATCREPLLVSQELNMLNIIWLQCIEKCHSKTLRQLLHCHARLVSISEAEGGFVAHIAFGDESIKTRAEGFLSSITNSFEIVLQHSVEIKIILLPDALDQTRIDRDESTISITALSDKGQDPMKVLTGGFNVSEAENVSKSVIPEKMIESILHQQRLETARVQAMEKGTPVSVNHLKPERNQILPQDGTYPSNSQQKRNSLDDAPSQHQEDDLNHELNALKLNDGTSCHKDRTANRTNCSAISPSLLHSNSFASNFSKDNMGYESGSGPPCCSRICCWNNMKPRHWGAKANQGTPLRTLKSDKFSWFRECKIKKRTTMMDITDDRK